MAINEPIQEVTLRLKKETTSKNTKLKRIVIQNQETGFYSAVFPIEIDAESITYILDAEDNKIDIYEHQELGNMSLEPTEIYGLWTTAITLADGTPTTLGDLLAAKIDEIILARITVPPPA